MTTADDPHVLQRTLLHQWHLDRGGRLGGFAGFDMPIRYAPGTIAEHLHTRTAAGFFDVSHMGVAELRSSGGSFDVVAASVERLVPCDVAGIAAGRQRYTQLLNNDGGIIDDLMISRSTREPDVLTVVSNAGRKGIVFDHFRATITDLALTVRQDIALVALQGPRAEAVLCRLTEHPERISAMKFMDVATVTIAGIEMSITRSGYTGEDGFELSVPAESVVAVATAVTDDDEVQPVGLGARDTLRLESGLCLYGSDIDESTSPIEAGLQWSIQKRRRAERNFPGATRIGDELDNGPSRRLVGLLADTKSVVRDHAMLFVAGDSDEIAGTVTSGGFGPSLGRPIAMGYVASAHSALGTVLSVDVRGTRVDVDVVATPFVAQNYRR